jgi:hypothetical protein
MSIELMKFLYSKRKELKKMYCGYKKLPLYLKVSVTAISVSIVGSMCYETKTNIVGIENKGY